MSKRKRAGVSGTDRRSTHQRHIAELRHHYRCIDAMAERLAYDDGGTYPRARAYTAAAVESLADAIGALESDKRWGRAG